METNPPVGEEGPETAPVNRPVPPGPRRNWKELLIISVSTLIVYGATVTYDFVNYDDYYLVYQNESFLKNPANIFNSFSTSAFTSWRQESIYYRPVLLVSYILDYQVWKLNPAGYHLTNLLLHILTSLILYNLFRRLTGETWGALAASLIFSLHPVNVESVAWVAGRNDILLALFVLLTLYAYHLWSTVPGRPKKYFAASVASFTLALFTKESAAFYILLIPLYELTINGVRFRSLFAPSKLRSLLPFLAPLAVYLFIRMILFGRMIGAEEIYGKLPLSGRLQIVPAILAENLRFLIAPAELSVEHPLDRLVWFGSPWDAASIAIAALFLIMIIISLRTKNVISFAALWLAVGLFPALNLIPLAVPILEHRLYTPMAAYSLLFVALFSYAGGRKLQVGKYAALLTAAVFGLLSFTRVPVWKNSETLWLDAIGKAPSASRAYFNLAGHYFDRGEYGKSIPLIKKYLDLKPGDFVGYSKLRQAYYLARMMPEAVSTCRTMIELDPSNENRRIELASLFEGLNMPDSAVLTYQQAIEINPPGSYRPRELLGLLYARMKMTGEAKRSILGSIRIKPDYAQGYFSLGKVYAAEGKKDSALMMIGRGEKFGPIPQEIERLREFLITGDPGR